MSVALVVDDSRSARAILARQLERHEVEVVAVDTGEAALEFLEERLADVIFMDHLLPGIDGFDALRAIKDNPKTADIPVLMYTSKRGEVYLSQVRALGAAGILPKGNKPVQVSKVLKTLNLGDKAGHPDPWKLETVVTLDDKQTDAEADLADLAALQPEEGEALVEDPTSDGPTIEGPTIEGPSIEGNGKDSDTPTAPAAPVLTDDVMVAPQIEQDDRGQQPLSGSLGRLEEKIEMVSEQLIAERELASAPTGRAEQVDKRWRWAAVGLAALCIVLAMQYSGSREQLARLRGEVVAQGREISSLRDNIDRDLNVLNERIAGRVAGSSGELDTESLVWALNLDRWVAPNDVPLNDVRLAKLEGLVQRLERANFKGIVKLNVHSGDFCLNRDGAGFVPAQGVTVSACDVLGNPLADQRQLQSREFTAYLSDNPILSVGRIRVEVVNFSNTQPLVPYPNDASEMDSVKWNGIAALNNRVEFEMIADQ